MANTTQIRLQAITGSLVDITSGITSIAAQTAVGSLSASDIPDGEALLRYYAQAKRLRVESILTKTAVCSLDRT